MLDTYTTDLGSNAADGTPDAWVNTANVRRIQKELSKTLSPFLGRQETSTNDDQLADETAVFGSGSESHTVSYSPLGNVPQSDSSLEHDLRSIYFRKEPLSDELRGAVRLLDSGRAIISTALDALDQGSLLLSDERVMDFKEFLPELFCLRSISESFGAVVNAVANGFENRKGVPLEREQLSALDEILRSLLREPAMSFERAVEHVMKFEDAGFAVESAALGGFLDLVRVLNQEVALDAQE